MASTYTTNLQLEKVATGEKAGLWGTVTNTNLEILEQASSGYLSVDVASGDVTLLLNDGATSNGKNLFFLNIALNQKQSLVLFQDNHLKSQI